MRDTASEAPDFVNELGVKWWFETTLTRYAFSKGNVGVRVWTVELPDGYKTRLLTKDGKVLEDDQSLDGLCMKIDIIGLISNQSEHLTRVIQ